VWYSELVSLVLEFECDVALNLYRMSLPVGTASVERSFSKMKMMKTQPRNRLSEKSLSYLIKISIESPQKLTDKDLKTMIEIWNRKARRIVV